MASNDEEQEPVVVRDRRRIDPDTGQRRTGSEDAGADGSGAADGGQVTETISGTLDEELAKVTDTEQAQSAQDAARDAEAPEVAEPQEVRGADDALAKQVEDLTADVKRVTAEYANYRKRVERDREQVIASAKASVAEDLLTVLDDIERADSHGDLTGAFKAVADKLTSSLQSAGLAAFGEQGEEFDPSVHEAVQHDTSPEVSGPTVSAVLRRGYRFGDRVLRPAMVAVTDHEPGGAEQPEGAGDTGADAAEQS